MPTKLVGGKVGEKAQGAVKINQYDNRPGGARVSQKVETGAG